MNGYKVDYHIHTTSSDGNMRPVEIVKQAKDLEYDSIAITDHNNVDGVQEALLAGEAVGLKVVPGIEIAAETEAAVGLHILGYNIDIENHELKEFLKELIENRKRRNTALFSTLQEMGYDISEEDIKVGKNSFISRQLIAGALVGKGYIENAKDAFGGNILGSPQCRKIRKAKPQAGAAIEVIRRAGGIPVLAHPIQTRGIGRPGSEAFFKNMEKIVKQLKLQGLGGLECYHPDQNEEQSKRFVEIAEKYHLHITRGSDFQGDDFSKAEETAEYR